MAKGLPRSLGKSKAQGFQNAKTSLTDIPLSVSAVGAGVGFGSLSLDDLALPEGDVIVLGIVANLSFTSEDANIAATWSGDFSIGTKATIDADLVDDDEANLLPSTAIGPAVADVIASARYAAVPVEAAQILELDAPEPLKINMLVDAANITDASTGVISVSGDALRMNRAASLKRR
jgi:hypothetical protein